MFVVSQQLILRQMLDFHWCLRSGRVTVLSKLVLNRVASRSCRFLHCIRLCISYFCPLWTSDLFWVLTAQLVSETGKKINTRTRLRLAASQFTSVDRWWSVLQWFVWC